jgi:4-oxalocrotonate tautomerase
MTEAPRRPLDMLGACLSAGRTFHVLEKGRPWAGFHRLHQAAALNGCCIIRNYRGEPGRVLAYAPLYLIFKRSKHMPFIDLKLVGKLTKEQKEIIAKEFSETLLRVAGKPKDSTYIVIQEVEGRNWAQGDRFFG